MLSLSNPNSRVILLAGLLAGLYEFPTVPNVAENPTSAVLRGAPRALLATLLAHPLVVEDASAGVAEAVGLLRIERSAPAGDVVHVFSHIRKTYRVQWILLLGGGPECPALACPSSTPPDTKPRNRASAQPARPSASSPTPTAAIWTPIDSVVDAKYVLLLDRLLHSCSSNPDSRDSIGTGVMKVWAQARTLWEDPAQNGKTAVKKRAAPSSRAKGKTGKSAKRPASLSEDSD